MKCTLPADINECPLCDKEKMECNKKDRCIFQENENAQPKEKYIRQERWYEKYYKKR